MNFQTSEHMEARVLDLVCCTLSFGSIGSLVMLRSLSMAAICVFATTAATEKLDL